MYNRFNSAQKQGLALKSYIPGIDSWIFPSRCYPPPHENLANELNEWIEKHPDIIHYSNIPD